MRLSDIQIRDPFVLPIPEQGMYYLYGTTDADAWRGRGEGFNCYRSRDLAEWEGPLPAFRPPADFWAETNFWAPEVHRYRGRYYMFASFIAPDRYRGTQILAADAPEGPFRPISDGPVTPANWQCLDGTFHLGEDGHPWIIFCHEWVQVHNGAIYAMRLSEDLVQPAGRPVFLFNASEASWVQPYPPRRPGDGYRFPTYVTDGPFLHRLAAGRLLMLWSSFGAGSYTMGLARSLSGRVEGPWEQVAEPLWAADGGHGMLFRTFDGRLWMTFHTPNRTPDERARFVEVCETADGIAVCV